MSQTTILVVDDSATIRRLVDSTLSQVGYNVVLAPTAEDGIRLAAECNPDLIILDHQLPGTTGSQVCQQLLASDDLKKIPVVVSSTLRKQAYSEYTDFANVIDCLPKPFAPEVLKTTVASAVETGKLIVQSQTDGTTVPEVLDEVDAATLSGSLEAFDLREVLDFLNNGLKHGALEVEAERIRIRFYLENGRIQAVTAPGIDPSEISKNIPDTLSDLAPVLNFTIGGRFSSEVDGLVELLDKKVLDPRLLRKLLRFQSAVLLRRGFTEELTTFRFEAEAAFPPLFGKLPLDISLVALAVDAALACDAAELPPDAENQVYVRRALRGQNLDRAGLSPQHMKLIGMLTEEVSVDDLTRQCGLDRDEVRRVLHGFVMADIVQMQQQSQTRLVFALDSDPAGSNQLREYFANNSEKYTVKVVRDRLALQLLLKRSNPDAIVLAADSDENLQLFSKLRAGQDSKSADLNGVKWIGIVSAAGADTAQGFDEVLNRPYSAEQLVQLLDRLFDQESPQPAAASLEPSVALTGAASV